MKKSILFLLICFPLLLHAQQKEGQARIDSLLGELPKHADDTEEVNILTLTALSYSGIDADEGIKYATKGVALASKLHYKKGLANAYNFLGNLENIKGNTAIALEYEDSAVTLFRETGSRKGLANCYYYIATIYNESNYAETIRNCDSAMKIYEETGNKHGLAICSNLKGSIYYLKGDYSAALKYDKTTLQLSQETGYKRGIAGSYYAIGLVSYALGNYPEALNNYFSALKIDEELGQKGAIANCYNTIGMVYENQKDNAEALKNFYAALKIMEEAGTTKDEASVYQNIAAAYDNEGNDSAALKNYRTAMELHEKNGDNAGIGDSYYSFAGIYEREQNYPEALKYYQAALKIFRKGGNKNEMVRALAGIGAVQAKLKKQGIAEQYGSEAVTLARKVGSLETIRDANKRLSETYAANGDYKKALEYYMAYIAARDSIFNEEATKKTVQAQLQYDFEKKEAATKITTAKKDAETKLQLQRKDILIYSSLSAFVVLIVIGLLLLRQRKLKANQQKAELEQKQLRAQMNPHFIFNCLNSIQHFVVINDVKKANKYLTGFASLMRQTLENSKDGIITLQKELVYLNSYLELELMRFKDKFIVEIICPGNINATAITIPSMIIQPFVENAIRHGLCFLNDRAGELAIKFHLKGNDLYCEIDDNGIGRAQSRKLKENANIIYESQGMALTQKRLALVSKGSGTEYTISIKDKVDQQNDAAGTTVIIKFPVEL